MAHHSDRPRSPGKSSLEDVQLRSVAPGKRPRTSQTGPVQAKGDVERSEHIHDQAAEGVAGSGSPIPHFEAIQGSFGHHDIGSISAHVGGSAGQAASDIGASAYAMGNHVAFDGSPDLHTAAHEAAHVIQQQGGVQLKGGVGEVGDRYEEHADQVADRVVQGKSAEGLLDQMAGPSAGSAVQMRDLNASVQKRDRANGPKTVSGKAGARLAHARAAIEHTKKVMKFGAGNQASALRATNFNSYFRLKVMRTDRFWEIDESVREVAARNPAALTAAKADIAHGGNCGEHATVAFDFLRATARGQQFQMCAKSGLDHAFVIIGDLGSSDTDADLVVSDPWPTAPTACLWEDHFAHTPDRTKIATRYSAVGDGANDKAVIAAGLRLTAEGQRMLTQTLSDQDTEQQVTDGLGGWVWEHPNAAASGRDYDYQVESEAPSRSDSSSDRRTGTSSP